MIRSPPTLVACAAPYPTTTVISVACKCALLVFPSAALPSRPSDETAVRAETKLEQVLALPAPSQCSTPGQLSVDLHLLRRAEALSVLEAVLQAVAEKKVGRNRPPAPASLTHGRDHPGAAAAGRPCVPASPADLAEPFASPPAAAAQRKAAFQEAGGRNSHSLGVQSFSSLEVVVGRGAHSVAGVPRLRPCVVGFLAGKGFRPGAVDGSRGQGVVVVGLGER